MKKEDLRKAYLSANKDPGQQETLQEWEDIMVSSEASAAPNDKENFK